MAFPIELASVLTGASVTQLRSWRYRGVLVPEVEGPAPRQRRYSFQDLMAGRMLAHVRRAASLQMIRKALARMPDYAFMDHLSNYRLAVFEDSIWIADEDGEALDLVKHPGHASLIPMVDIFNEFENFRGDHVVPFLRPRPNLVVSERRRHGWPTVNKTRVTFNAVANLVDGETVTLEEVGEYFPGVTLDGARDALSLDAEIRELRGA